jgi:protein TonB
MSDSDLGRGQGPKSRVVLGFVLSAVLHVGVLLLVVWLSTRPPPPQEGVMRVTLMRLGEAPMAAPPPPPPPSAHQKKPDLVVQSKKRPQEKQPPEVEPELNAEEEESESPEEAMERGLGGSGVPDGVIGGVVGGVVGGTVGGTVGGVPGGQVGGTGTEALPFGTGMTRPRKLSGPPPQYTREALAARVEGVMIVKCIITAEGRIEQCRILKPLPYMEQAVLDALYAQRYQPVTSEGRPIPVDYTFNIRLTLPN